MPRQKVPIAPATRRWLKECEFEPEDARKPEIEAMIRVCRAVDSWAQYDGDCDGIIDREEERRLQGLMVHAINILNRISAGRRRNENNHD